MFRCSRYNKAICVLINYKIIKVYGGTHVYLHAFLTLRIDCYKWLTIHLDSLTRVGEAPFILCGGYSGQVGDPNRICMYRNKKLFSI